MKVLLFQREGVGLLRTLLESETSRGVIRFYHPKEEEWGIEISLTSLGSALSLISELRWYVRRYVSAVLFRVEGDIYCTHTLARLIYEEREEIPIPEWPFRKYYRIDGKKLVEGHKSERAPGTLEVLCTEEEFSGAQPLGWAEIGPDEEVSGSVPGTPAPGGQDDVLPGT